MKIALTIDDAPSISREAEGIPFDPHRMDSMRVQLKTAGIKHCVAFVIGNQIKGNEGFLERWLADGFEIGNHTFSHSFASKIETEQFKKDIGKCDNLLEQLGVFRDRGIKWFRFPRLDRGNSANERKEIADFLRDSGYTTAHASFDFFDHVYEVVSAQAKADKDFYRASLIGRRYRDTVEKSFRSSNERMKQSGYADVSHIGYCHFGIISSWQLPNILDYFNLQGVEWCTLEKVINEDPYVEFDQNYNFTGLVSDNYSKPIIKKFFRKLINSKLLCNLFSQSTIGSKWPYV